MCCIMSVAPVEPLSNTIDQPPRHADARAGLRTLLRQGRVTAASVLACAQLPPLAPGWADELSDESAAIIVADAIVQAIEDVPDADAARALFGLTGSTENKPLGERRGVAAELTGLTAESFRVRREPRLLDDLVRVLLVRLAGEVPRTAPAAIGRPTSGQIAWDPWVWPAGTPGHGGYERELEQGFAELARYVAPEALADVRWDVDQDAETLPGGADRDDLTMIIRLYERLSSQRIDFWREPWLPGGGAQRIRHPWLLVNGRAGTCLDFATTYAAMCLDAAIPPLLALTRGATGNHATVILTPDRSAGYSDFPQDSLARDRDFAPGFAASRVDGVVRLVDWSAFEGALDEQVTIPIDFDRAPAEHRVPFEEAVMRGREHLRQVHQDGGELWLIDVAWLQHHGLDALPPPATRAPIRRQIPGGRTTFDDYGEERRSILAELRRANDSVVLLGASGTGKSTVAREIAFGAQFGAAWFLNASDPQSLITSLDQAERAELGIGGASGDHPDRSGYAINALTRLSRAEDEWVVVVDNADGDPGKLVPWLPRANPNRPEGVRQLVLITTTNRAWAELTYAVRWLTPVSDEQANRFLPGSELVEVVRGRPLMFDAFKRMAGRTGWSAARIAQHVPAPDDAPDELRGPATLWAAAKDADGFDDDVLTVVAHAAYLPPDRQPLAAAAALAPAIDVAAARDLLVGLGLLSIDVDENVARMHRLFGAAVRADLESRDPSPSDEVAQLIATTDEAYALLDSGGDLATITLLEDRLEDLDRRTVEPSEMLGRAMHGVAELLELHGHTGPSGERYRKAERHLEGNDLLLGLGLHGRARTINQHFPGDEKRLREALEWSRAAGAMLQRTAPDKAERCLAMQGLLMQKLARFPRGGQTRNELLHEALEVIERADRLRRRRLQATEPDNPELLRSRFNRAGIRIELAKSEPDEAAAHLTTALGVYREVGKGRRRIYGRDQHPHIAACVIGEGYVGYYRALLLPATKRERTEWLREATERTIEALGMRQAQEGAIDGDEVAKVVRFLTKVALARDALIMTPAHASEGSLRSGLGSRFEAALEEIVDGLADEP
jgi:hypothetical protein